ncbi:hypothetical protein NI437_000005 [Salmonella enterica]|nr:hypothetical protein [Salmonella enterica]
MKKTILAVIASLVIGFGAGYGIMHYQSHKTFQEQSVIFGEMSDEIKRLEGEIEKANTEYQKVYDDKQRYLTDKNNTVMFAVKLCKVMKEQRDCLMELALQSRSPYDIKD